MPQNPTVPMGPATTTYKNTFEIVVDVPAIELEDGAIVSAHLFYRSRPDAEPVLAQAAPIATGTWADFISTSSPKLIKFTPNTPGFYFVNFTAVTLTGTSSPKVTRITNAQTDLIHVIR